MTDQIFPVGAEIIPATALNFGIVASPGVISEELGESSTFTITLAGDSFPPSQLASVRVTAGGTAEGGTDYTPDLVTAISNAAVAHPDIGFDPGTGILSFTALSSLGFTVTAQDDAVVETPEETISLALSDPATTIPGANIGINPSSATVTLEDIEEGEGPPPPPPVDIVVTTLADSGPGSLREALSVGGVIGFDVGGVIVLEDRLVLSVAGTQIRGETAPSPGITLVRAPLQIRADDFKITHIRSRVGDENPGVFSAGQRDAMNVGNPSSSVHIRRGYIGNCSLAWSVDGLLDFFGSTADLTNVIIDKCLLAEPLHAGIHPSGPHSFASNISAVGGSLTRVAYVRTIMAHAQRRCPEVSAEGARAWIQNLLTYNTGTEATQVKDGSAPLYCTILHSQHIAGADTDANFGNGGQQNLWTTATPGGSEIYIDDLVGTQPVPPADETYQNDVSIAGDPRVATIPPETQIDWTVMPDGVQPPVLDRATELVPTLLAECGARPWERDATDARIVSEIQNGTGRIIDNLLSEPQASEWAALGFPF